MTTAAVVGDASVVVAANATAQDVKASAGTGPAQSPAMDKLVGDIRAAFEAEKALGHTIDNSQDPESFQRLNVKIQGLLKEYAQHNPHDWRRYAFFNDVHYVRNLVEGNSNFELLVLCWKYGQVSRVHNHGSGHCWLTVLEGDMREVQYQRVQEHGGPHQPPFVDELAAQAAARRSDGGGLHLEGRALVDETKTTDMRVGDVGYINDHIALHTVGCHMAPGALPADGCGGGWVAQGGVTLHLYAPPIRRVRIYENDGITERTPGYYSRAGVRV
ncbi:hypothetical protein HYH03_017690 [Edaphochlamys debaryana]|uniref:Cysteine dioxygenase n=1 Tax=Edaphochlamys debaryana TaxID=47281 RepID=A0A835XGR3_9CHLO|nr:hypothetical protein HYH03_017690 [Edaphochlamys debaryana]|eukprot:KAG2483436.1 hypothetical protein HYH03_017690 [Edaphochlamys debaryana]